VSAIEVRQARPDDVDACVDVLARLPDYFTPDTHDDLRRTFAATTAWVATATATASTGDGVALVGFVLAERRHPGAAEITYAAVLRERQGAGVGTALVDEAIAALAADGVALVEVKTLDASAGYAPYEATRAFWEGRGFRQIDRIDPLPGWQPGNPAAIYVAALRPTR
jgi:ribosomal protein S18 acetylase RimI-like enzyme